MGFMAGLIPAHDNLVCASHPQCWRGGVMSKRYGRPSAQYRYEHYDPTS